MPSPALAYPFRQAAESIDRTSTRLMRAEFHGADDGVSVPQLRGSIIEDIAEVANGCGPEELVELARVVASFARGVK